MFALVEVLRWRGRAAAAEPGATAEPAVFLVLGMATGAAALWAWWRYRAASIRTDETGITQHTVFRVRHIPWPGVREYYQSGDEEPLASFACVVGERTRIRFWTMIGDQDELKAEIARRSINSRTGEWGPRTAQR